MVLLEVMAKPVVPDIDMPGSMLIEGVLEKGECTLIVTVECDTVRRKFDEGAKGIEELLSPDDVLARFGAGSVLGFGGGCCRSVEIHFYTAPTNETVVDHCAAGERVCLGGGGVACVGVGGEGGDGRGHSTKDQPKVLGVLKVAKNVKVVVLMGLGWFVEVLREVATSKSKVRASALH